MGGKHGGILLRANGRLRRVIVTIRRYLLARMDAVEEITEPTIIDEAVSTEDRECAICREGMVATISIHESWQGKSEQLKMVGCGHACGKDCVVEWLKNKNTCPLCRDEVDVPIAYRLEAAVK